MMLARCRAAINAGCAIGWNLGGQNACGEHHPAALFPLLEAGTFAETLYYRLNILCFEVTDGDS